MVRSEGEISAEAKLIRCGWEGWSHIAESIMCHSKKFKSLFRVSQEETSEFSTWFIQNVYVQSPRPF